MPAANVKPEMEEGEKKEGKEGRGDHREGEHREGREGCPDAFLPISAHLVQNNSKEFKKKMRLPLESLLQHFPVQHFQARTAKNLSPAFFPTSISLAQINSEK